MTIHFRSGTATLWLVIIGGLLSLIAGISPIFAAHIGDNVALADFGQFDLRNVGNFLALFTTVEAAAAALLVCLILHWEKGHTSLERRYWQGLAVVFAYIALDETVKLRDSFNHLHVHAGGWLAPFDTAPWLWFYLLAAAACAWLLTRFPHRVAVRLALGGVLYITGLIVAGVTGPLAPKSGGLDDLLLAVLAQSLRMGGMLVSVQGLLEHLERTAARFTIRVATASTPALVSPIPDAMTLTPVAAQENKEKLVS